MDFHPVANIFPLLQGEEYESLKSDIAKNGLIEPIWLHPDGRIVDGRNRWRACVETNTNAKFETWNGQGSLIEFVISLNLHRRHLDSSQCAAIALDVLPMLEDEARERQRLAGGDRKSEDYQKSVSQKIDEAISQPKSTQQAAQLFQTNRQYVSDAKRIKEQDPVLFEQVKTGTVNIVQAKRELKERKREEIREENRKLVIETLPANLYISGQRFQTLVLDPPWDWGDEGDIDQFGRARPTYHTMTIEEISDLPIQDLACQNAHLYLWITNRSLPKGFGLLEKWGFRYVTCLTWIKPSIGMGNYFRGSTEQVLFAVKGSLPLLRNNVGTWFEANRPGEHSGKPDEFYSLVESCSPGPWLEMFSRKERNGWVMWGAEI